MIAELAFVVPFLLVGVIGAVDFARAIREAIVVDGAAEAGAFHGAQSETYAANIGGIQDVVYQHLASAGYGYLVYGDGAGGIVEVERYCKCYDGGVVDCDDGSCGLGSEAPRTYVKVAVEKPFYPMFRYPGMPESIPLRRESHVRAR